jgi:cell division septal protein FtsQ
MPQTRKRKRTRLKPGPILVLLLIAVLVSGVFFSPVTSLSNVTVVGAKAVDRTNIDSILKTLNNIPCVKVNRRWVETRVQRIEAVDHATYSQNIFGRGRLVVNYRVPVARVRSAMTVGLDSGGVMFETDELPPDLPVVVRPENAKVRQATVMSGFPAAIVADLAAKARQLAPKDKLTIWFNREGALCMSMAAGLVVFGGSEDIDLKLHTLKDLLDQRPDLFTNVETLTLTDPSHPATTYKKQRE